MPQRFLAANLSIGLALLSISGTAQRVLPPPGTGVVPEKLKGFIPVTEEMLHDYAKIRETLKSDAVRPVGGIGFVSPGMLRPRGRDEGKRQN